MSMHIQESEQARQQAQSALFSEEVTLREPDAQDPSVQILGGAASDSQVISALLGTGPEIPGVSSNKIGGRSFTELMVEVQKALAQMSYDTKIVSREQSVTYGRAKAETIDDGADKVLKGAWASFITSAVGAGVGIGFSIASLKYMNDHGYKVKTGASKVERGVLDLESGPSSGSSAGRAGGATERMERNINNQSPEVSAAGRSGGAPGKAQGVDAADGSSLEPDGAYISPIMNIYNTMGASISTIINSGGDIYEKHMTADKLELDADGQLFDTYAGEQSQFYQDADKNASRALGLIGSLVGQIYNTNSSIIANLPR